MNHVQKETLGERLKRWNTGWIIAALAVGALGIVISPFAMWNGSAEDLAKKQASAAVLSALTDVCVGNARDDPDYTVRVAELDAASTTSDETKIVTDFGWANLPGMTVKVRGLEAACAKGVLAAAVAAAAPAS